MPTEEDKKNELNLRIREVLSIMDMIDGQHKEYFNYEEDTLNNADYLEEQIKLVTDIKERLLVLPEQVIVFPGHRGPTTIGAEKKGSSW